MLNLHGSNNRIYNVRRGGPSDFNEYKKKYTIPQYTIIIYIYLHTYLPPIQWWRKCNFLLW